MRSERTEIKRSMDINSELNNIKNIQPMSGGELLNYTTMSSDSYDWYVRIYETQNKRQFRVTLTHSKNKGAIVNLLIMSSINTDVVNNQIPYLPPTAPPVTTRWYEEYQSDQKKTVYRVVLLKGIVGEPYYDTYHKFVVDGTDTVTWSIAEI